MRLLWDFEHSDEIANLFKMFSDKTRVNILLCLKEKRECSVDEISELPEWNNLLSHISLES